MAVLYDPLACRYVYSFRIQYGTMAVKHLPILFLPPDDKMILPSLYSMSTTKLALHQQS